MQRSTSPRLALPRVSLRVILLIACLPLTLLSSCARIPRHSTAVQDQQTAIAREDVTNSARINLNSAPTSELEKLPGIGRVLAERIVAHREQFGPFSRAEHLMMVQGISDHKFRAIRELVRVE